MYLSTFLEVKTRNGWKLELIVPTLLMEPKLSSIFFSSDLPILKRSEGEPPILKRSEGEPPVLKRSEGEPPILKRSEGEPPILKRSEGEQYSILDGDSVIQLYRQLELYLFELISRNEDDEIPTSERRLLLSSLQKIDPDITEEEVPWNFIPSLITVIRDWTDELIYSYFRFSILKPTGDVVSNLFTRKSKFPEENDVTSGVMRVRNCDWTLEYEKERIEQGQVLMNSGSQIVYVSVTDLSNELECRSFLFSPFVHSTPKNVVNTNAAGNDELQTLINLLEHFIEESGKTKEEIRIVISDGC
jgi:hypothetical protein